MTIWMLYTAWALVIATALVVRLFVGPRCPHEWKVTAEKEFGPMAEEATKLGFTFGQGASAGWWIRIYFAILRCDKCGGLKTFKVKHYPGNL